MPANGHIVITGASTGIGEACAVGLAKDGYHVFAGVRRDEDGARLAEQGGPNLTPLKLDVTDEAQLRGAVEMVSSAVGDDGLAGLMNNAGVSINGPLEYIPLDDVRRQLEVNVVGLVAATQAFLPLIKKARGRIINVSSVGGFFTTPVLGPYCASKYAVEAITDALRRELRPWGVHVVAVQPAAVRTAIWQKGRADAAAITENASPGMLEDYGGLLKTLTKFAEHSEKSAADPECVLVAVRDALSASTPKARYLMGTGWRQRKFMSKLPARLQDNLICKAMRIENGFK